MTDINLHRHRHQMLDLKIFDASCSPSFRPMIVKTGTCDVCTHVTKASPNRSVSIDDASILA